MNINDNLLYAKCPAIQTDIFFQDRFAAGHGSWSNQVVVITLSG